MEDETKICTICKTGKADYGLDKKSVFCTYIENLKDEKCSEFKRIEE